MTRGAIITTLVVLLVAVALLALIFTGDQVAREFGGPDWSGLSPGPSP